MNFFFFVKLSRNNFPRKTCSSHFYLAKFLKARYFLELVLHFSSKNFLTSPQVF